MTLDLRDVTVDYGKTRAVDRVSLRIDEGAILALVGPSGCGKSSLLRAIAGLVPLADGAIAWRGEDLTSVPTERRDLGFMFQDHALFSHRDVAGNVAFGLRMRSMAAAERDVRVEELLDLVGLGGFGTRSVESLSGGEAQRVALARALAPNPRILLLDEPLASLDRARRDELIDELGQLLRELEQTAIYVTHDHGEAFALADRLAVMRAGEIVRCDAPAQVWRDPQTEFVARFVGHETIIERDGRRYAVRADAISFAPTNPDAGPTTHPQGEVVSSRFQGDRYRIVVSTVGDTDETAPWADMTSADMTGADMTGAGTTWTGWSREPLAPGTRVEVVLDPDRLAPLD